MAGKQICAGEYDQDKGDTEKAPHDKVLGSRVRIIPERKYEHDPDANIGTGHHCGNEESDGVSLEIVNFINRNARKLFGCVSVHANPLSSIGL